MTSRFPEDGASGALAVIDALMQALGCNPKAGLQIVDASALAARHDPGLDPGRPACLRLSADTELAQIATVLSNHFPSELGLRLLRLTSEGGALEAKLLWEGPLVRLSEPNATEWLRSNETVLLVPPLPYGSSMLDLAEVVAHLRAPEGCPWDREQTHESLRPYVLEEAYETADAIDSGDPATLAGELGDLLLQIALHAQIGAEAGTFQLPDVIRALTEKLLRRHPHVFGDVEADTPEAVLKNWEALKAEERKDQGRSTSPFSGIPKAMPALARAQTVQRRARRIPELREDGGSAEAETATREAIVQQLWALVALAVRSGVDSEAAMAEATERYLAEAEGRLAKAGGGNGGLDEAISRETAIASED